MALNATIYKAALSVADIDHGYYADHALTLAMHPSESGSRLMARLVAYALNAHQIQDMCSGDAHFDFGRGLSEPGTPDLALVDYTQTTRLWIDVGQSDDKALAKACSKSDRMELYAYLDTAHVWWKGLENKVSRLDKLSVWYLGDGFAQASETMLARTMALQATIQDGSLSLSSDAGLIEVDPQCWKSAR
ncbi:MAG: hypothetical protein RL357_797 [Pseudomonadota bacterium]|jgi:uncharacterized protein YaeQ